MCTSFQAKYKILDKIGEGSFSEVLKCQERQTGIHYAAKRLKKIYQNVNEILESPEIMAMRKISRHPNVLHLIESHYDLLPGRVTLIFELMDMSLYDLMKKRKGRPLVEARVKNCIYQLLKGLDHLHKHGIFHRDIKPENILIKGNLIKIGDLGMIRGVYSRPPYTEYISTRWYRSPECLLTGGFYGPKIDVWAAGCVFYELLTLEPLFPGENEVDQITKIHNILGTPHARLVAKFRRISRTRNGDFYFPTREGRGLGSLLSQISKLGLEALELMLVYDPENRATARKLIEHRYFTDLRDRESVRQTRNTLSSTGLTNGSQQSQHPMVLAYLSSERHRRLRLLNACQSQLRCADAAKTKRTIESVPYPRSTSILQTNCDVEVPNQTRLDELAYTQVGRYFLRKRQSHQNNRLNVQPKKWYDNKTPNIRYGDKRNHQSDIIDKKTVKARQPDVGCQSFYLNKPFNEDFNIGMHQENSISGPNKLPSIFLKPKRHLLNCADTSTYIVGDSYKVNLTGIPERTVQAPTRKLSVIRSPLKKVARHETGNDYYLRSASFDPKRLICRKA